MFSPLWLLRNVLVLAAVYGIGGFIALWVGWYPTFTHPRDYVDAFKPYKLPEFHGFRVLPAFAFIPIAFVTLLVLAIGYQYPFAIGILIALCIVAGIFGTICWEQKRPYNYERHDDGFITLAKNWLHAKKARFCPTVEFSDGSEEK